MSQIKTLILVLATLFASSGFAQQCEERIEKLTVHCPDVVEVATLPDGGLDAQMRVAQYEALEKSTSADLQRCMSAQIICKETCGKEFRLAEVEGDQDRSNLLQEISSRCEEHQLTINSLINLQASYRSEAAGLRAYLTKTGRAPASASTVTAMQTLPGFR